MEKLCNNKILRGIAKICEMFGAKKKHFRLKMNGSGSIKLQEEKENK